MCSLKGPSSPSCASLVCARRFGEIGDCVDRVSALSEARDFLPRATFTACDSGELEIGSRTLEACGEYSLELRNRGVCRSEHGARDDELRSIDLEVICDIPKRCH